MPEVLDRHSPLAGLALAAAPDITLTEAPYQLRASFRGTVPAAASLAGRLGLDLPAHNRASTGQAGAILTLGPDEWLLLAGDAGIDLAALDVAVTEPHALVEISDRNIGLDIAGPRAADCLNAGNPLDLHIKAFPVGMATRTLLGKAEIVLWRTGPERFRIEVVRSFAPYVAAFLVEAAREYL